AYRRALVSNGNFRGTFNYKTKKNQYEIRGHFASQDFFHQESGGLTPEMLENCSKNSASFAPSMVSIKVFARTSSEFQKLAGTAVIGARHPSRAASTERLSPSSSTATSYFMRPLKIFFSDVQEENEIRRSPFQISRESCFKR
ncbi:MAG TPA: hypothetical protein EYQ81_15840, partial [Sneathiellales bacterium]|nr:hypothetical protein [Sneathiellales bacterium]